MSRPIFFIFIFLSFFRIQYAFDNFPTGARSAALSHASVANTDIWSLSNNQAGLAFFNHFAFGIHHENRFLVSQFAFQSAMLTVPTKTGVFGFNYAYFGYPKYNEKKIGLAFSKLFFEKISVGVQLDYLHTFISENYGTTGKIAAEAGIIGKPIEKLTIGFHVFNFTNARYNDFYLSSDIPFILRMGAAYSILEKLQLNLEIEKESYHKEMIKAGFEYQLYDDLFLRAGFSNNPSRYSFGLGYIYRKIYADIAFISHTELGFTPHFSIAYLFK